MPQTHKLVGRRYSEKRVQSPDSPDEGKQVKEPAVMEDTPVRKRGRPRRFREDENTIKKTTKKESDDGDDKKEKPTPGRKRKVTATEDEDIEKKMSKVVTDFDSPGSRRSSRKVVPNRKYADMVMDIFDVKAPRTGKKSKIEDSEDEDFEEEDVEDEDDEDDPDSPQPSTSSAKQSKTKTAVVKMPMIKSIESKISGLKASNVKTPGQKTPGAKTPATKTPLSKTTTAKMQASKASAEKAKTPLTKTTGSKTVVNPSANKTLAKTLGAKNAAKTPASDAAPTKPSFIVSKSPGSATTTVKRTPIAIQSSEMQAAVKEAVRQGKSTTTVKRSSLPAGTSIKTTVVTIEKSADNKPRKRIRVITVYPEDSSSDEEPEPDDEAHLLPLPGAPPPSPLHTLDMGDDEEKLDPFFGDIFTGVRPSLSEHMDPTPQEAGSSVDGLDSLASAELPGSNADGLTNPEMVNGEGQDKTGKIQVQLVTFTDDRFIEYDPSRRVELTPRQVATVSVGRSIYMHPDDAGILNEPLMFMDADSSSVSTQTLFNGGIDHATAKQQQQAKQMKPRKPRGPNVSRVNTSNILRDLMTTTIGGVNQNINIPIIQQPSVEVRTATNVSSSSKALRYVTVVPGPESVANMPAGTTPQTQYVIVEFDEDMSNLPQEKIASLINSVTHGGQIQPQIQHQIQHAPVEAIMEPPTEFVLSQDKIIVPEALPAFDVKPTLDDASGTFLYRCTKCYYSTLLKGDLLKHRRKHSYMKLFRCKLCSYSCATSGNLKRHQAIHTNERAHTCTICGYKFRQKIHVIRHIKYKHQEKTVCCPLCDYVCANENPDLKTHMKRRHSLPVDEDVAYKCPMCDEITTSIRDLQQHLKMHKSGPEMKMRCDKCSFVSDCNSRFKRHQLVHTREKPFACSLCVYRASQKEHVVRHMRSKHSMGNLPVPLRKPSTRPVKTHAGVSRDGREATRITQRIVNSIGSMDLTTQEKIFGCNHCSMKFAKLINLYKHLYGQHAELMPDQETNFNCVVCDFKTWSKKNLLIHMRKHNLHDQSAPTHVYTCVLCTYVNPRRRNLLQHMKKKHTIDIITGENGATIMCLPESGPSVPPRTMELAPPQPISQPITSSGVASGFVNFLQGSQVNPHQSLLQSRVTVNKSVGTPQRQSNIIPHTTQINVPLPDPVPISQLLPNQQLSLLGGNVMNQLQNLRQTSGPIQVLVENPDKKMISVELSDIPTAMDTVMSDPAVEAIEGLQALSAQNVDLSNSEIIMSNGDFVQDMAPVKQEDAAMMQEVEGVAPIEEQRSFQLTDEQLMNLSSGDFIEINGEIYKVEFSS